MRFFISMIAGIAVALVWLAIWALMLHGFGIPFVKLQPKDRARRQERIKQMGKLRYIVLFGVLGYGLAFGLGLTTAQLMFQGHRDWTWAVVGLVLYSALWGWFYGARTWNETFREPVPFPPEFLQPK